MLLQQHLYNQPGQMCEFVRNKADLPREYMAVGILRTPVANMTSGIND